MYFVLLCSLVVGNSPKGLRDEPVQVKSRCLRRARHVVFRRRRSQCAFRALIIWPIKNEYSFRLNGPVRARVRRLIFRAHTCVHGSSGAHKHDAPVSRTFEIRLKFHFAHVHFKRVRFRVYGGERVIVYSVGRFRRIVRREGSKNKKPYGTYAVHNNNSRCWYVVTGCRRWQGRGGGDKSISVRFPKWKRTESLICSTLINRDPKPGKKIKRVAARSGHL